MYNFLALFVALFAVIKAAPADKGEALAAFKECKASSGWNGDYLSKDITHERKCFYECLMKKFGVMGTDGKINKDKAIEVGEKFIEIHGKMDIKQFKEVTDQCIKEVKPDPEHCEAAFQYVECFKEKAHKE